MEGELGIRCSTATTIGDFAEEFLILWGSRIERPAHPCLRGRLGYIADAGSAGSGKRGLPRHALAASLLRFGGSGLLGSKRSARGQQNGRADSRDYRSY